MLKVFRDLQQMLTYKYLKQYKINKIQQKLYSS